MGGDEWGDGGGGGSPAFGDIVVVLRICLESNFAPAIDAFEVESGATHD